MQRAAQRDDRDTRDDPRARRAKRLSRVLVCAAAVPVMLVAAGCSSDSGSGSGSDAKATAGSSSGDGGSSVSASPTVQAAAYAKLPEPCTALSKKTLGQLVPKGLKSAKEGTSDDTSTRSSCSWNSLDNNGVKGSQFRWLNVSLLRFESDANRGSGNTQAQTYYAKQVKDAQAVTGAKSVRTEPVAQTGDEATLVRYDLKKKEGTFKQQTVVTRVQNIVVTLDYNGAGLAGDKTPAADDLVKAAEKAAREVVAAVSATNGDGSSASSGTASTAPSASKSASKSPSPSPSPSKSAASKTTSPSASASKKS